MQLYPQVQSIVYTEGAFDLVQKLILFTKNMTSDNIREIMSFLPVTKNALEGNIHFTSNPKLLDEGYTLHIQPHQIIIESKSSLGQLWGIKTLKQIIKQSKEHLPCLYIEDAPVLSIRGYMLDISRGKIPKLSTLYAYIDMLSDLKMNHFELYVEGFSYLYPSFDVAYFENTNALSVADFKKLDRYARSKGIDFVPCHNTFGHMTEWLKQDAFRDLSIMKDGMQMWGGHRPASTLDPLKEKSVAFVKKLIDDALLGSTSKYVNICFDEAYELGHGPTQEICEKKGIEALFLEYLNRIYRHLKEQKKTVMMWGDFFNDHPNALKDLPKDIIVIDWGYDHYYPFDRRLKKLHDHNILFISSPGTSSWNSISGRTFDMLINIEKAIEYTKKYQGLGTLLTDWGDNGHIQYPIISYPAIIYTALESWSNHTGSLELVKSYLNTFIYEDANQVLGNLSLDIGTYYRHQMQYSSNGTQLFTVLQLAAQHKDKDQNEFALATKNISYSLDKLKRIEVEFNLYLKALKDVKTEKNISHEIMAFKQTIHHVLLATHLLIIGKATDHLKLRTQSIEYINKHIDTMIKGHEKTWLQKNQPFGLSISLKMLKDIKCFIQNITKN